MAKNDITLKIVISVNIDICQYKRKMPCFFFIYVSFFFIHCHLDTCDSAPFTSRLFFTTC